MGLLEGKVGIVTGSASGLGRATCLLAAEEGSRVVVSDIDEAGGKETVARVEAAGGEAFFVNTDVSDPAQVKEMVEATLSHFGALDWASNNAVGGSGGFAQLHETSDRSWRRNMEVTLDGVFYCLREEIAAMLERGSGSIVNIITASVSKGEAMLGPYIAAKGGVDALTRTAASEYAARGIRVNSVAPGGFNTPAIARYFEKFPDYKEQTIAQHALRRIAEPDEIAQAVIWLASDRSSFVTGANVLADGGINVNSHLL